MNYCFQMKPLIIIGAGGHGRVVVEAARAAGEVIERVISEVKLSEDALQAQRGRLFQPDLIQNHRFVIAIGNQQTRRQLAQRILCEGGELATVVHPAAWVSPSARVGAGTVVIGAAIVNANASLGGFSILNTSCSVDHDCTLADGTQICPGARLAGGVSCGDDVFVGTGAVVLPGLTLGEGVTVGAGAVVLSDVAPHLTVVGNPAHALRKVGERRPSHVAPAAFHNTSLRF